MYQEPLLTRTQNLPWKPRVVAETVSSANLDDENVDSILSILKAPAVPPRRIHEEELTPPTAFLFLPAKFDFNL